MASKKITQLSSGSLNPPLSGVTTVVYSGTTHQQNLSTLRQVLVDSGSHNFTGSQRFDGDITVTGSVKQVFGALDNGERDFVKVSDVVINGKPYNIVDFSFQDLPEYGDQYKNALVFEYFNGTNYEYGSEMTINGKHINLAVYASGSENLGRISIRDNYDGTTFGNFYADLIEIGAYSGSTTNGIIIGHGDVPYINIESQITDINSEIHLTGSIIVSGNIIGDGSQLTNLPTNLTNVSMFLSSSTFNTFTSSYDTTSASFDSRITAATNEQDLSYLATTGSNTFVGNQIVSGSVYMGTGSIILPNGTEIYDTGDKDFNTSGIGLGNNGFNIDFGSNANDWARFTNASLIQVEPTNAFNIIITSEGEYGWFFNGSGMSFPDGTTQTTAYTGPIETGSLLTTSSFNEFTSSQDTINENVNDDIDTLYDGLNDISLMTSSFATTGSNIFIGNQTISGSLEISGSGTLNNNTIVSSNTIEKIETITSASYASITPTSGTLYIVID